MHHLLMLYLLDWLHPLQMFLIFQILHNILTLSSEALFHSKSKASKTRVLQKLLKYFNVATASYYFCLIPKSFTCCCFVAIFSVITCIIFFISRIIYFKSIIVSQTSWCHRIITSDTLYIDTTISRSSTLSTNVLLTFDMHGQKGALFSKVNFLFLVLAVLVPVTIIIPLIVCFCHVMYAFQSESTLHSCLNVKELLARNRREIWRLNGCLRMSVCLRTKWFWVRFQLQSLLSLSQ